MLRIKHLLLVEGLTLAGARRKLEEEAAPVAADAPAMVELIGQNARERLTAVKRGLRSILDLLGPNGDRRVPSVAAGARTASRASRPPSAKAPARRPRRRPARRAAPKSRLAALIDLHVASGVSRTRTPTGCSAAWLAHLTGGQGVAGSNPAIPYHISPESLP